MQTARKINPKRHHTFDFQFDSSAPNALNKSQKKSIAISSDPTIAPTAIKRGDKVQGPISHEQFMSLAKQKKLKKSDLIGNFMVGPFNPLLPALEATYPDVSL
ncbi:hypothetical protein N9B12_00590 [bacterium]|nr:hypothetical protein [bacterium]